MIDILPLRCSCCPRQVGQVVRRADGEVRLVLVSRHDKGDKHVTFWTAEQIRQLLQDLEQATVDTGHNA